MNPTRTMSCGVELQMHLGSRVAVAVVWAGSCSSQLIPSLRTSICCRCSPKKQRKKERKKNTNAENVNWGAVKLAWLGSAHCLVSRVTHVTRRALSLYTRRDSSPPGLCYTEPLRLTQKTGRGALSHESVDRDVSRFQIHRSRSKPPALHQRVPGEGSGEK